MVQFFETMHPESCVLKSICTCSVCYDSSYSVSLMGGEGQIPFTLP